MMRSAFTVIVCSLLSACQGPGVPTQTVHDLTRLATVTSIYIENLGKEKDADLIEGSDLVREEISTGLARSGRFSVVQSPQEADAVLAGLAGFEKWYHGMEGFYGLEGDLDTHYLGVGHFRLVESKTNQTIWTHEYKRGLLKPTQSVTSRVAEQVVENLLRDAARADGSR
jgi:TolB-like protein